MEPQPTDPNAALVDIEQRMRTVRIIWMALVVNIGLFYFLTRVAERPENNEPNDTLSLALLAAGVSTVLVSFVVKSKLIGRAIEQRQVQQVQQGYVVAWAMSEVAALLGLLDFFITSDPYFYALLIIAALGQLFHFPRREHFENASFNPPINL
ncbi:MAG TPA: hypothetical protein VGD38_02640 [Pyrinomonadaceae bacterium]